MKSLKRMLYELTMDKDFVALKFLIDRPNVFHVVGATHLETWHSKFLSWLLDPTERHMLGYYPFQRFLMIVAESADETIDEITDIAMLNVDQFRNPEVTAEKDINKLNIYETNDDIEKSEDRGRLDVFFRVDILDEDEKANEQKLILAIEQKVYAKVDMNQCNKYLRKFEETFKTDNYLLVSLIPKSQMKESNEETFGDSRWIGVDYQQLVDFVLMPCLDNPDLNAYARPIIQQYVDALRMPYKNKREKLATIEEERLLVRSIYDRFEDVINAITSISNEEDSEERDYVKKIVTETYGDIFRTIRWILDEENDIEELWNFVSPFHRSIHKRWNELTIVIQDNGIQTVVRGESVPEIWNKTLCWIEEQNLPLRELVEEGVILGSGERGKRYAIAMQPVHQDRRKFTTIREYQSILTGETYFIEAKINSKSAMQTIAKMLNKLGVKAETPLLNSENLITN
ncbi:PD-(D/E)XK nuclease family protein [Alkalihalobacillus sp. FSL R5-0424]